MRRTTKRATLPYVCHLQDVRRPIATTRSGRPRQVPVACKLDILEVREGDLTTWAKEPMYVTCDDCRAVIEEGEDRPFLAGARP